MVEQVDPKPLVLPGFSDQPTGWRNLRMIPVEATKVVLVTRFFPRQCFFSWVGTTITVVTGARTPTQPNSSRTPHGV